MSDKDDECDICEGTGRYPIFDKHGTERFSIACPECGGLGLNDNAVKAEIIRRAQQLKYDDVMANKRARP